MLMNPHRMLLTIAEDLLAKARTMPVNNVQGATMREVGMTIYDAYDKEVAGSKAIATTDSNDL